MYFRILGEHTLLSGWFNVSIRQPCPYKFEVKETTEKLSPKLNDSEDEIINNFSKHLLLAHGDPVMIKHECKILLEDLQDLNLSIIKNYIETEILPEKKSGFQLSTWIGNFGETLAASILIDSEGFWFPIYKLRFREKKDWAMKLTDLCLIKTNELNKPLICYGEVKTQSSSCNVKLGIEGHDSLIKDDALQDPEIIKFFCTMLYSMNKFDEAEFFSKIRLEKIDYDKQHRLFIVHEQSTWKEEILSKLNEHDLSPHLIDFSVNVVLINQLRKVIDETYSRAWRWVEDIEQPQTQFTFDAKKIWKYCDYLFSESTLLLKENFGNRIAY